MFSVVFSMAFIFSFTDDRLAQLEKEDKINDQLQERCNECPELLAKYYYLQRKKNKQMTNKIAEASCWSTYDTICTNMEQTDDHLKRMEYNLQETEISPCTWLAKISEYNIELPFDEKTFAKKLFG